MPLSALEYLRHIRDETDYLLQTASGLAKEDFADNKTLQRPFVRSIEVIGEAAKQVPITLKRRYLQLDWRGMAGMRDLLIHRYFGVDYDIVWDVVTNKIPELQQAIEQILQQEEQTNRGHS